LVPIAAFPIFVGRKGTRVEIAMWGERAQRRPASGKRGDQIWQRESHKRWLRNNSREERVHSIFTWAANCAVANACNHSIIPSIESGDWD
jgi:hypothetical protein